MTTNAIDGYWIDGGGSDGEIRCAFDNLCNMDPTDGSRDGVCTSKSKACHEKMRRDRLNKRFLELSSILDPGRPPKADKATILSDATHLLKQLKAEAQELKESNEKLQDAIKDLKVEKNELREEKMRLRAGKDRLEQQIKALSVPPGGFLPHLVAFHPAAFSQHVQATANKTAPFTGFPGMAMWQWLPPAVMDTTQDAKLWPPIA